jgi:stress-induced morphogen
MSQATAHRWHAMQTPESRQVEDLLRGEFAQADAYRYNSASIRIRVIDPRFAGKSVEERDAMVEPYLDQLPQSIQSDIMNLLTLAPGEGEGGPLRDRLANLEFEDPSPSGL